MATRKSETATTATATATEAAKERNYIMSPDAFDQLKGQEFGGQSDLLQMEQGECAGPFTYCGHSQITTELGETTSHLAFDDNGDQIRLPIQATFLKAIDQARIQVGDTFAIKRWEDQEKKKGKGAGNMMAIYSVKVLSRAAVEAGRE